MKYLWFWITRLLSGKPHFYIGGVLNPYMLRWFLIPRNPFFNIYLHKFVRDDDDRALHDHPWWFISVMLKGGYVETTETGMVARRVGSIAYRCAEYRHRVQLFRNEFGLNIRKPCWTLVITGRKVREWGFWCPKGFVHWKDFVDTQDHGNIGKGCE